MAATLGNGTITYGDGSSDSTNILNTTAAATVGSVGTYAFLGESATTNFSAGQTESGANLRYAGIRTTGTFALAALGATAGGITGTGSPSTPAGTWRCMGSIYGTSAYGATLWLRIS